MRESSDGDWGMAARGHPAAGALSVVLGVLVAIGLPAVAATPVGDDSQPMVLHQPVERVEVSFVTRQGQVVRGEVAGWNAQRLIVATQGSDQTELAWSDLFASTVFATRRRLMDVQDAGAWVALGGLLRTLPGGLEHSESALKVAELLDPAVKDAVAAARARPAPPEDPLLQQPPSTAMPPAPAVPRPPRVEALARPDAGLYTWGDMSLLAHEIRLREARAFAREVGEKLGVQLTEVETTHFLYFTNVPPHQTFHSPRLLDQMYDKACELYGIPRGTRLFMGKCSVFMLATQEQLQAYVQHFGGHAWAAGFCQTSGDGVVRIVMFQGEDRGYTTQTLLHETAHGVNWRYRAPVILPPWLEEGIAEWVASNTTGQFRYVRTKQRAGVEHLQRTRRLGESFFGPPGIREMWEYGVAYDMTDLLIRRDRHRFVQFVNAIKDGREWKAALEEVYQIDADDFLTRYGQGIGVPDLRR